MPAACRMAAAGRSPMQGSAAGLTARGKTGQHLQLRGVDPNHSSMCTCSVLLRVPQMTAWMQVLSKLCLRGHVDHAAAALLQAEHGHSSGSSPADKPAAAAPSTPTQRTSPSSSHFHHEDPLDPQTLDASAAEAASQHPMHSPEAAKLPPGMLLAELLRAVGHQTAASRLFKALLIHCSTAEAWHRAALQACVSRLWSWSFCRCELQVQHCTCCWAHKTWLGPAAARAQSE